MFAYIIMFDKISNELHFILNSIRFTYLGLKIKRLCGKDGINLRRYSLGNGSFDTRMQLIDLLHNIFVSKCKQYNQNVFLLYMFLFDTVKMGCDYTVAKIISFWKVLWVSICFSQPFSFICVVEITLLLWVFNFCISWYPVFRVGLHSYLSSHSLYTREL